MSQNNIPNTLPSIERLISRISTAEKSQQKEIRISIQEAREIMMDLSLMTARLNKTVQEIHGALMTIKDSSTNIEVRLDGGGFR
jgi:hypothetical protein